MKTYDVIVIGSGGGTKIARPAAQLGYKAAIIEESKWGGTCLNRGCIPSKMLIHPANVIRHALDSGKIQLHFTKPRVEFSKLVKRITSEVGKDSRSIPKYYNGVKNLDWYQGHARFVDDHTVEVNGKKLYGKKIFIATGARPFIPPIEGLHDTPYWTSADALRNTKLPKRLLVIGGGYIAAELGHAYGAYGTDVQLLVRDKVLLRREDSDISKEFTKQFSSTYNVHFKTTTEKVEYKNKTFHVTIMKNGRRQVLKSDALLVATGVRPNSDTLGLENTNIKLTKRGFVKVDRFMETSVRNVYALGDVVGNYMFRHSVNFEGEFLFNSHFVSKKRKAIAYPPIPHAVFSFPEVAGVGRTEDELKAKKKKYVVGMNTYKASAQGMARRSRGDFCKLLFDARTKKLLGAHIIGPEASVMIHQLIYAMTFNATLDDLLKMIYIHPALPEIVRNAARNAKKEFK